LSRPKLRIIFSSGEGDREPKQIGSSIITVSCHRLHIRNATRYSVANEVQGFVTKIESRQPTGDIRTDFSGAAPLPWQHQALYSTARNIGYSTVAYVDFLYVALEVIHLASVEPKPESLAGGWLGKHHHLWITVVARGLNAESKPVCLEIRREGESMESVSISLSQPAA
jgi:hypothetical protein